MVPIDQVHPNPKNPRKGDYDATEDEILKDNIEAYGQQTSVKIDENGMLLAGHRRHRVMKRLGRHMIRADVYVKLSEFDKSALLIADNATQKKFDAWAMRKTINDIYWNEFLETYVPKNHLDKGYGTFAAKIGINAALVSRIVDSLRKENIKLAKEMESKGIGTNVLDVIMKAPKDFRPVLKAEAKKLIRKKEDNISIKKKLIYKTEAMRIEDRQKDAHPSFINGLICKMEHIKLALSRDFISNLPAHQRVKLAEAAKKNILPVYKQLIKQPKARSAFDLR